MTCYQHGDRRAGVSCQRCDRPICPSCMVQAAVGFHCPECSRRGRQRVYDRASLVRASAPLVTQVLVAVNVAVFLLGAGAGGGNLFTADNPFTDDYGLIGSVQFRFRGGGLFEAGVGYGEWWRVLTGGFLHAGPLHLGFNMFALWMLGSQLEPALGRLRFGIVYGVSLLTGVLGVMLLSPHSPTVGASGAIFGLFGLALAAQLSRGVDIWQSGLGGVLLINLLFTFGVPGISIGGHLGGLAGGFLCGAVLYRLAPRPDSFAPAAVCAALGVLAAVGSVVAAQASAF